MARKTRKKRAYKKRKKTLFNFKRFKKIKFKFNLNLNFLAALINLAVLLTLVFFYKEILLKPQLPIIIPAFQQIEQINPVNISFPSDNKKIPIESAHIINGNWQTSNITATHLITSSGLGGGGNIVIYGHNTKNIFRSLKNIKVDEKISLESADNKIYEYQIQEIKEVTPEEVSDVQPTDYEVLTIYTCTGWLDSRRLIVKAYPASIGN
ncbi:MAG: sortase [Patescibacteria group bacterium]